MLKAIVPLALALAAAPTPGADSTGAFMLGGGAGSVKCPQFVSVMEKGRSVGIGTVGYVNETQGFTMYILGFQSGYNLAASDTYDVFPGNAGDYPLLSWVENWCRSHAKARFGDGVVAMANVSHQKRQRAASETK
jgi:hypothetical protein